MGFRPFSLLAPLLLTVSSHAAGPCLQAPAYPPTHRDTVSDTYFTVTVPDPYRWLEDASKPAVRDWIQAQNRACAATLAQAGDAGGFGARLKRLMQRERCGLPQRRGTWLFYSRQKPGQEQPVLLRRLEDGGTEQVLLDPNAWPKDSHAVLGDWFVSQDGARLAYVVRWNNADRGALRVLDVPSGKEAPEDRLDWADWADFAWSPDSLGFYYTRQPRKGAFPDTELPGKSDIAYHRLGAGGGDGAAVFPASQDPEVYESPQVSDDGRWLFILKAHGFSGTDILAQDLTQPGSEPLPIFSSVSSTAQVLEDRGTFFILSARDAPHGAVYSMPAEGSGRGTPRLLLPERRDYFLDSFSLVRHRLVLLSHHDAASVVEIRSYDGRLERTLRLPGHGSVEDISGQADDPEGFLTYQSFTQPEEVERFRPESRDLEPWQSPAQADAVPGRARVEQIWYPSTDGTRISMFLVRPEGQARDGQAPFVLEGYGGFATSLLPRYWPALAALLEDGFGVAIPNLRGGGEYGEDWHRAGMLQNKQNTFDDFASAARALIAGRYTSPGRLAIMGNSNGGLLVAAALAQWPRLFGAAVCGSPLTDMVRYPLFGEGQAWVPEYGDPRVEPEFRALAAYSPYHRLKAGQTYPPTLIVCAEDDDRVDPMHARKFAAALQAAQAGPGPVLLHTLAHAGHGGAGLESGREGALAEQLEFLDYEIRCGGGLTTRRNR
jgi:prolyl oligopeptidase